MNEVVNYDALVGFLKQASLFEVYRLSVAISTELDNPKRIAAVVNKFKEGDIVEYFEEKSQRLIKARVFKKSAKYVSVEDIEGGRRWRIPYYMLKIDSRDFIFEQKSRGLNRNALKVGDIVGFSREGEEITGKIARLNQKTVSLVTNNHHRWRVPYTLLYPVIEGEKGDNKACVIEHQPD